MVSVNWTKQSKDDLISIAVYIANDSVKYAKITVQKIRVAANQLKRYPNSGRIVPESQNLLIRELIHGNYRIIYFIKSTGDVDILTVHHSSKLLKL